MAAITIQYDQINNIRADLSSRLDLSVTEQERFQTLFQSCVERYRTLEFFGLSPIAFSDVVTLTEISEKTPIEIDGEFFDTECSELFDRIRMPPPLPKASELIDAFC